MTNNFKQGSVLFWVVTTVLIIAVLIVFFFPELFFKQKKSNQAFGVLQRGGNKVLSPSTLNWKKSFSFEKKKESDKPKGSYMRYMIDKNKKKH